MTLSWLQESGDQRRGAVTLNLHIQPGARKTEFAGLHGEALKLRLAAPPVDGKANACLLEFLARSLELPKRQLELVSGQTSRSKRVRVDGLKAEELVQRLQARGAL